MFLPSVAWHFGKWEDPGVEVEHQVFASLVASHPKRRKSELPEVITNLWERRLRLFLSDGRHYCDQSKKIVFAFNTKIRSTFANARKRKKSRRNYWWPWGKSLHNPMPPRSQWDTVIFPICPEPLFQNEAKREFNNELESCWCQKLTEHIKIILHLKFEKKRI